MKACDVLGGEREMKIMAISPWFGSKRNLAQRIIQALGKHRVYWEPFCGSMAVLLAKPSCVMETVNDLHGDLINLAKVIQSEDLGGKLYRRLRRTLMHEGLFHEAAERVRARGSMPASDPPDLERAADYFLCSWMGRNGVAGTKSYNQNFCVRYTSRGGHAGTRYASCVESIPAWRRRLRTVTILNRDGFDLLERIEDEESAALYIDPPYLVKGALYVHDFQLEDHKRLARALDKFHKARVVVSYYDHPMLKDLYPSWAKIECPMTKSLSLQGSRGSSGKVAPEVLLVNQKEQTDLLFA